MPLSTDCATYGRRSPISASGYFSNPYSPSFSCMIVHCYVFIVLHNYRGIVVQWYHTLLPIIVHCDICRVLQLYSVVVVVLQLYVVTFLVTYIHTVLHVVVTVVHMHKSMLQLLSVTVVWSYSCIVIQLFGVTDVHWNRCLVFQFLSFKGL